MQLIKILSLALIVSSVIAVVYEFWSIKRLEKELKDASALVEVGVLRLALVVFLLGLVVFYYA